MDKSPISAFFAMVAVAAAFSAGLASGDILPPPKGGYFAANSRQTGTRRPSPVAHPELPSPAEDKPENPLETLFEGRTPRKAERDAPRRRHERDAFVRRRDVVARAASRGVAKSSGRQGERRMGAVRRRRRIDRIEALFRCESRNRIDRRNARMPAGEVDGPAEPCGSSGRRRLLTRLASPTASRTPSTPVPHLPCWPY